ncbi:MAG: DUF3277 family protein [Lachnospiraceae bacterium]|nr:DUF3277 family protein [Lachnospiraceae bacterium]
MDVKVYDPKDCVITVGGVYITGLGEDMVTCEKDEDNFTTNVGAQGDVVVNKNHNQLGTIKITVQGTSPQKKYLLGLAKSGELFNVWVINKAIEEKCGGTQAMVKKPPELSQGKELDDREFEIQVFDYVEE